MAQTDQPACFERVVERPSAAHVLAEARPCFRFYPFSERLPRRFFQPAD